MLLRKIVLLLLLSACWTGLAQASAANIYITQTGATSGVCVTSVQTPTFFNTSGNWGAGAGQIGLDTVVHLCGTITTTPVFQGSGTSGHPITLKFETGARISQPFAPSNALLNLNGKAWLVIDGGVPCGVDTSLAIISEATCNGIIEATANGTNLANHQGTNPGIEAADTDNVEIKNIDLRNIYVRVIGSDENPGDSLPAGIRMPNATNMHIHDMKGHDADWFYWSVQCSGSTSNIEIDHVDVYNINHGLAVGVCANAASNISFHDSHVGAMVNWDDTLGNGYHHDGVHLYVVSVGGTITGVSIYNLLMDGDWGTFTSAHIFMEGSVSATIFNNVFNPIASQHMSNGSIYNINSNGSDVKNIKLYNNTFIYTGNDTFNGGTGSIIELNGTVDVRNNALILTQASNGVLGYSAGSTGTWNFNAYASATPGGSIFSLSGGGPNTTYSAWKTAGRDVNSPAIQTSTMNINTTTGVPSPTSAVVNAGTNLTGLGIAGLNVDRAGVARPSSGSWTIGAYSLGGAPPPPPGPPPVLFSAIATPVLTAKSKAAAPIDLGKIAEELRTGTTYFGVR